MKDMRHGRGDNKILKRARSKANSLPGTPKNLLTEEINRRCRTDIKKRRAAQLAIGMYQKCTLNFHDKHSGSHIVLNKYSHLENMEVVMINIEGLLK